MGQPIAPFPLAVRWGVRVALAYPGGGGTGGGPDPEVDVGLCCVGLRFLGLPSLRERGGRGVLGLVGGVPFGPAAVSVPGLPPLGSPCGLLARSPELVGALPLSWPVGGGGQEPQLPPAPYQAKLLPGLFKAHIRQEHNHTRALFTSPHSHRGLEVPSLGRETSWGERRQSRSALPPLHTNPHTDSCPSLNAL